MNLPGPPFCYWILTCVLCCVTSFRLSGSSLHSSPHCSVSWETELKTTAWKSSWSSIPSLPCGFWLYLSVQWKPLAGDTERRKAKLRHLLPTFLHTCYLFVCHLPPPRVIPFIRWPSTHSCHEFPIRSRDTGSFP